jgi:hypothetical protein
MRDANIAVGGPEVCICVLRRLCLAVVIDRFFVF